MSNKPLDKAYLLTQFKNFFEKKVKGAFVPSTNLDSTTEVVAKDLDITVKEGSVDIFNESGSIYLDAYAEDVYLKGHSKEQYNTQLDMCSDVTIQTRNNDDVRTEIYMDGDINIRTEVGDAQMKAKNRVVLENISNSPSTDVRYSKVELDYDNGLTLSSNRQVTVHSKGNIDLDADENINLKPTKKAYVNDSEIWTESKFPHNLIARYIGGGSGSSLGVSYGIETSSMQYNGVPYLYGELNSTSSTYTRVYPTSANFVAPYTGSYYLGVFRNDGDDVYKEARKYIEVYVREYPSNVYTRVMDRTSDLDKCGTHIELTAGKKYGIVYYVYKGINVPSDNRFYTFPAIYESYAPSDYDYRLFYSTIMINNSQYTSLYRGINSIVDLYDMVNILSKEVRDLQRYKASQWSASIWYQNRNLIENGIGVSKYEGNNYLTIWMDSEDYSNLVTIGYSDDEQELHLTFICSVTYYGIRFRLLDYYGGNSTICVYDHNGDRSWQSLSDKSTGWQLMINDFDSSMDCGIKLHLYGADGYDITGSDDSVNVTITALGGF